MVKVAAALSAILMLAVAGAYTLTAEPADKRQDLAQVLESAVTHAEVGDTIDLSATLGLSFDRVGIITPYADNAAAAEALGVPWEAERAPAYRSDGYVNLVFVKGGRVIAWCQVARSAADFETLGGPFTVDAPAVFVVTRGSPPFLKALTAPASSVGGFRMTLADPD
jgi:hypothetical protein